MKEFKGKLIETIQRTSGIMSFRFMPLEEVDFLPGQFVEVVFDPDNKMNRESNKYLSFSSSPLHKNYFEVTKRLSDSVFSNKLRNLKKDDEVVFRGPLGNCVFNDSLSKIGFVVGGIGITPVISMLEYIVQNNVTTDVILWYSNRTEDDIAFKKELDFLNSNEHIRIIYTVTDCPPTAKDCSYGVINKDLMCKSAQNCSDRLFFIFGPPSMVEAMKKVCVEFGIENQQLKTESFLGYK